MKVRMKNEPTIVRKQIKSKFPGIYRPLVCRIVPVKIEPCLVISNSSSPENIKWGGVGFNDIGEALEQIGEKGDNILEFFEDGTCDILYRWIDKKMSWHRVDYYLKRRRLK